MMDLAVELARRCACPGTFKKPCVVLNQLPGLAHMRGFGVCLADAQAQGVTAVQDRVRQVKFSALVQALQQPPVEVVSRPVRKANQIERGRGSQLKVC